MNDYATQIPLIELLAEYAVSLIASLIGMIIQLILTGLLAKKKGRSAVGWCIASVFFGMIPFIILAFKEKKTHRKRTR